MAVVTDRNKFDDEIRAAKEAGMVNSDIAFALDVHRWVVDDACKRHNLTTKNERYETPIKYNERPLVEKTCPVCRRKHMSDPAIWTCIECKEIEARENMAVTSVWF
jgi:ribosomal protein L37AE/L43A